MPHHLAQVNIARLRAPLTSDQLAPMRTRIDHINALAETSPGFLWRHTDPLAPDLAQSFAAFLQFENPDLLFFNLSLWNSPADLHRFTFSPPHLQLLQQKSQWMLPTPPPHLALWWLPANQLPTPADALTRLQSLRTSTPSPSAFTFASLFPSPA